MFLRATIMDFALKIILLFLLIEIPCFITDSKQLSRSSRALIDINKINKLQNRWTADLNYFTKLNELEVRVRMGSRINPKEVQAEPARMGRAKKDIPKEFDARKEWPNCYVIGNVKDQANCGSCWAVATASAFSDRRCISHKQKTNLEFSGEDILTCCDNCLPADSEGDGCQGGFVPLAWQFIRSDGVVTGGDYGSRNTCKPYSTAPCILSPTEHCDILPAPKCKLECTNMDYKPKYKKDKKYGGTPYLLTDEKSAKQDLMINGPFVAMLKTCLDFLFYRKGIYYHVFGNCEDAYHAVKVIGWGEEDGVDYWLAVNTWNTSWGENGLFKIDKVNHNSDFGYFTGAIVKRF